MTRGVCVFIAIESVIAVLARVMASGYWRIERGRMSVQTSSMYARQADFGPENPASLQPRGSSRLTGQIEYCSSSFTTTM